MKTPTEEQERQAVDKLYLTDLEEVIKTACLNYRGHGGTLMAAIGALVLSRIYGWRVVRLVCTPLTYRKYERVLGIKLRDYSRPEGPLVHRSYGLSFIDSLKQFWDIVTGKQRLKDRGQLTKPEPKED
jgi:hypothetical protein